MSPQPPAGKKVESSSSTASAGRKQKGSESEKVGTKAIAVDKAAKTAEPQKAVDVMALEEMQSLKRSPECDSELYASNCALLRDILDQILQAKLSIKKGVDASVKSKVQSEINELRVRFGLAFINLKKLNRLDKLRTKRIRENTSGVMQRVDQFHLQLQNLRYEVMHLEKEVTKCLQFRSADQDINMISEEEFLQKAPEEIKQKVDGGDPDGEEKNDSREHRLRLARLEFERMQRRQMHETVQKLNGEKRAYHQTIGDKKSGLAGLKPQLAAILDQTRSVQDYLDMPLDEERDQLALSRHLPPPLFVLFSEMRAYGHACDKDLKVEILGELDEAKTYNSAQRNSDPKTVDEADEDEDGSSPGGRKKKHAGREEEEEDDEEKDGQGGTNEQGSEANESSNGAGKDGSKEKREETLKRLTRSHPLTVRVRLDLASNSASAVEMVFAYLTHLKIVTVKVSLTPEDKSGSPLVSADSLLAHLMCPDDDGCSSPNPTTFYLMRRQRMDTIPKAKAGVGSAYRWAQVLAGLQFPDEMPGESEADEAAAAFNKVDKAVCQARVETLVKAIKQRVLSRLALAKQVSVLESAKNSQMELDLPADVADLTNGSEAFVAMGSSPVRSKVRAWYGIDYESYERLDITKHLMGEGAVSKNDFFYRLQVNRDSATLIALISVSADYPTTPPVFCLNLHWNNSPSNTSWTVHNSEKVRALEREINTCYRDLVTSRKLGGLKAARYVISLQVRRLMVLFDVLLESWNQAQVQGDSGAKVDFPREKIFLQPVRGRTRAPPLRYDRQLQIFTQ